MTSASLRADAPVVSDRLHLGSGSPLDATEGTIDQNAPVGPSQVRLILAANAFGRPTSLADEAERYLHQVHFREHAFDDLADAEVEFDEDRPEAPEACYEVDVGTQCKRLMTREEMMERVTQDFGGSGALWPERVLEYDRWRLAYVQAEMRYRLPQLKARADRASENATDIAWRILDKPASTIKDVAVKLGVFMLEVGEVELKEDDAKPLRQLCAELLSMVSPTEGSGPRSSSNSSGGAA